jgi:hypothetical protein
VKQRLLVTAKPRGLVAAGSTLEWLGRRPPPESAEVALLAVLAKALAGLADGNLAKEHSLGVPRQTKPPQFLGEAPLNAVIEGLGSMNLPVERSFATGKVVKLL